MKQDGFILSSLQTEYMDCPLGMDTLKPRFSWQMSTARHGAKQIAYRILVNCGGTIVWDSGKIQSGDSNEIQYEGKELEACRAYQWNLFVWDDLDISEQSQSIFETGFLDGTSKAWEGAQWIGAEQQELDASTKGVFRIETKLTLHKGSTCGGIAFGAEDFRLLDTTKNIYGLAGEHYFAVVIDIEKTPVQLSCYRVGYAPNDQADVPLYSVAIDQIITEKNRYQEHSLAVEVHGNVVVSFVDGVAVDKIGDDNTMTSKRVLNPLGMHDVITFPRMASIGFYAGKDSVVSFNNLTVKNVRTPKATLLKVTSEAVGIFEKAMQEEQLSIENGQFYLRTNDEMRYVVADPTARSMPMLRRQFAVDEGKELISARAYISCRGIYTGYLNEELLSDDWFCPGATHYDNHITYSTYDITESLTKGENVIGFCLSSGWWSDSQSYVPFNYNFYGDRPSLLCKLDLRYVDGSVETIVSEPQGWSCSTEGPERYSSFFHGEIYDATRAADYIHFTQTNYDAADWYQPVEITPVPILDSEQVEDYLPPNHQSPQLIAHHGTAVKHVKTLTAVDVKQPRPGVYNYDMGQNMVGVPSIHFQGEKGERITLRYGETTYPDLPQYQGLEGLILLENYRDASVTDIYICNGDAEGEKFQPRHTFRGYRYVEISGVSRPPETEQVQGIVLSSIVERRGGFECSNPLINKLYENINWSQRGNYLSIPTDCPQRNERMGWLGDAIIFVRTAQYNADVRHLLYRFLQSIRDLQTPEGKFPNVAPFGGGFGGIYWGSAGITVPWEMYIHTGDRRVLEENYDAMVCYLEYLTKQGWPGLLGEEVGPLGDWLATEATDLPLLWNALFAYNAKLVTAIADVLGKTKEQQKYLALYQEIKILWNQTFVDDETRKTINEQGVLEDTQASYAIPLYFGIVEEENEKQFAEHLNRRTIETGYILTTGFFGTPVITTALSKAGYKETAHQLLQQTKYPSWLYSVTEGATTIWERWNSETEEDGFCGNNNMNSFNHCSLGGVGSWMYAGILGIQQNVDSPGFKHVILRPEITPTLTYAKGYHSTVYGRIESHWEQMGSTTQYQVTIPANTSAELHLPKELEVITSETKYCQKIADCHDMQVFSLASGQYTFTW